MSRATNAPASRRRRKMRLKQARGFSGARSKWFRLATESVNRAMHLATVHRRHRKQDFRAIWTVRLSAACENNGITYSKFIGGLAKAGIALNRKMLSEIAIHDPVGFKSLVEEARACLA